MITRRFLRAEQMVILMVSESPFYQKELINKLIMIVPLNEYNYKSIFSDRTIVRSIVYYNTFDY
jgi:hypothetical protein